MMKNLFRLKLFDDSGRPIHEFKNSKPKKLKDEMDKYFDDKF